ncbi:MAG: 50S ribosomal protein L37ae [Candidatus Heimdallarchaeaceae archaeon]
MGKTKKVGSTGRFGTRYGSTIRKRVRQIEEKSKAVYKCPVCQMKTFQRVGLGIWQCSKCGEKRAGGAWEPNTSAGRSIARRVTRIAEGLKEEEF